MKDDKADPNEIRQKLEDFERNDESNDLSYKEMYSFIKGRQDQETNINKDLKDIGCNYVSEIKLDDLYSIYSKFFTHTVSYASNAGKYRMTSFISCSNNMAVTFAYLCPRFFY